MRPRLPRVLPPGSTARPRPPLSHPRPRRRVAGCHPPPPGTGQSPGRRHPWGGPPGHAGRRRPQRQRWPVPGVGRQRWQPAGQEPAQTAGLRPTRAARWTGREEQQRPGAGPGEIRGRRLQRGCAPPASPPAPATRAPAAAAGRWLPAQPPGRPPCPPRPKRAGPGQAGGRATRRHRRRQRRRPAAAGRCRHRPRHRQELEDRSP